MPNRGPMGGGAFIVAQRGTVYVTPGPYLPIAKRCARIARNRSKTSKSKPDRQGMRRLLAATPPIYAASSSRYPKSQKVAKPIDENTEYFLWLLGNHKINLASYSIFLYPPF